MGHPAARDGGGADHQPGGVVELVEAHEQQVGQGLGQRVRPPLGGRDQLLGEERVALGALDDAAAARARAAAPGAACAPARARRRRRGAELEPGHAGQPAPLGGGGAQRVAAVQVVAAVGRDDRDGRVEAAGEQEAEHLAGRLVGPVGVLDEQQQGAARPSCSSAACTASNSSERSMVVASAGVRARARCDCSAQHPPPGHQPGDGRGGLDQGGPVRGLGGQPAEHLAERQVGQRAVAEVEAVADEHPPAPASARSRSSASTRVLPTPASPASRTADPGWLGGQADQAHQPVELGRPGR